MKIFEAFVTDIEDIPFEDIEGNDELARQEGFEDSKDMLREFKKMYGGRIDPSEEFQIIYFEKLCYVAEKRSFSDVFYRREYCAY